MRPDTLLTLLESRGARLSNRDGKLVCNAPRGVLTAELRGHIGRLKPDLLALLAARARAKTAVALSPAQVRIRDLARLLPKASPAGNVPLGFTVKGPLDARRLGQALSAVVEAHAVFRTVCVGDGAQVFTAVEVPVDTVDLRRVADADAALAAAVRVRVMTPFELGRAPILRAALLRVDDETQVALVVTHVFAFDGRSTPLFTAALSAALDGRPIASPATYADLDHGRPADRRAQTAFWTAALADVDLTCPLTDRAGAASAPAGHVPVTLGPRRSAALVELARTCRATVFHTVMAAFQTALHRASGQPSLAVGTIVSHRRGVAAEGTIGSFAHNILFPARFTDSTTFRALVDAQRDHARLAMAHLDLPLEAALGALAPAQRRRRPYETMCVVHHGAAAPTLVVGDLDVRPHATPKPLTAHALDLVLAEHDGVMAGELSYDADRIDAAAAQRLVTTFVEVLDAAIADPDRVVGAPGDRRSTPRLPACAGEPPRTPTEASIAASWTRLLAVPGVTRDAGFFALGGHSLLALTMLAEVEAQHGRLPPEGRATFAADPTVATLAALYAR